MDPERPEGARPENPAVDPLVLEFIRQVEDAASRGAPPPDLDEYCAGHDPGLRDELKARCVAYLDIQKVLGSMRSGSSGAPEPDPGDLPDPLVGRRLGDFRLERRIGEGGMGIVYVARQLSLDRRVAIKVLPGALAAKRGRPARFEREARAPARLDHPGIVKILEAREEPDLRWYAMEYVAGRSLHEVLQEMRRLPTPEPGGTPAMAAGWISRAARIAAAVADALQHAHERGVIHRDAKPQNILIDASGAPRLVDFGLALDEESEEITKAGDVVGTPHYMSPEQVRGERSGIDARTDVYSLGVVLYEMLTLRRPFDGATRERVLAAISSGVPRPVGRLNPQVPRDLATICHKAIEREAKHRYASAADFARDLRHFLHHEAIEAEPPPVWRRIGFAIRQRRALLTGFLAGAVVLSALAFAWRAHERSAARPKLTVRVGDADRGALVALRRIDERTGAIGERVEIGTAPLEGLPLEPGCWRVIVERPGFGFGEYTRTIESGSVTVEARLHETSALAAGMVAIPEGEFEFGMPGDTTVVYGRRRLALPEFRIDLQEVTNAEYRDFLLATGRTREPGFWIDGFPAGHEDLPVVGVSCADARDYAEWAGKRLPTVFEWEKAARGSDGRIYPWGDDPAPLAELFPPPPPIPEPAAGDPDGAKRALFRAALERLSPANRCEARLVGPHGLLHALGNVQEWTETIHVEEIDGSVTAYTNERFAKGGGWYQFRDWRRTIGLALFECLNESNQMPDLGFRCAKSSKP